MGPELKSALRSGQAVATQRFNMVVATPEEKQTMLDQALQDITLLAELMRPHLEAEGIGVHAIEKKIGQRANGKSINLQEQSGPMRNIEIHVGSITAPIKAHINDHANDGQGSTYDRNSMTLNEALEAMTSWAASVAPDAIEGLDQAVYQFEMQKSVDRGEWNDAPHR